MTTTTKRGSGQILMYLYFLRRAIVFYDQNMDYTLTVVIGEFNKVKKQILVKQLINWYQLSSTKEAGTHCCQDYDIHTTGNVPCYYYRRSMCMRLVSTFVAAAMLLQTMVTAVDQENKKRLVLFAGPHRSGSTSVEEFFHSYCKGYIKHNKDSFPMRYWKWPEISQEHAKPGVPPYKVFQNLVLEPSMNDSLNMDIMAGIREAYDTTQDGIILGTELFDQLGTYSQYDGMLAMKRIVDHVGLTNYADMVTVVVNYRAPRFGHWESVWKGSVEGTDRTYQDFMCHTSQYDEKIKLLATSTNPLQVALESQKQGWNVALMDMQGIQEDGLDISHTIACDVMNSKCQNTKGWVNNHVNKVIHNNEGEDGHDIVELTDEQRFEAEELLLARDCAYGAIMKEFQANKTADFTIYHNSSLWKDCDPDLSTTRYRDLLNPDLIFRGLLSQLQCDNVTYDDMPMSIDDVLSGKFTLEAKYSNGESIPETEMMNQRKNHYMFFWFFAIVGVYVAMSIYKNNGRIPAAWIMAANTTRHNVREWIEGGHRQVCNIQMESMPFGQSSTTLSGQIA
jgi:hypothetical protein